MMASIRPQQEGQHPDVAVLYSKGPHFHRVLKKIKKDYPEAVLTVFVPKGYPLTDAERGELDEVIEIEPGRYSLATPRAFLRLIHRIRQGHYDVFAVLFPSFRLRLVAAVSGAGARVCYPPEKRVIPLRSGVAAILVGEGIRRAFGGAVYAGLWLAVRMLRVGHQPPPPAERP